MDKVTKQIKSILLHGSKEATQALKQDLTDYAKTNKAIDTDILSTQHSITDGVATMEMCVNAGTLVLGMPHNIEHTVTFSGDLVVRNLHSDKGVRLVSKLPVLIKNNGNLIENVGYANTDSIYTVSFNVPSHIQVEDLLGYFTKVEPCLVH